MSRNMAIVFAGFMLMMFACIFLADRFKHTAQPWTPPASAAWRAKLLPLANRERALEVAMGGGLRSSEAEARAEALQQDAYVLEHAAEASPDKGGLMASSTAARYARALVFHAQTYGGRLASADLPLVAARKDLDSDLRLPSSHDGRDALWARRSDIMFGVAFLLFFPLMILIPVGVPVLQALQGRRVRRVGVGMRARITDVAREGVINYVPRYRLRLRLETGQASTAHVLSHGGFTPGDYVAVLVDPRRPGRAVLA